MLRRGHNLLPWRSLPLEDPSIWLCLDNPIGGNVYALTDRQAPMLKRSSSLINGKLHRFP